MSDSICIDKGFKKIYRSKRYNRNQILAKNYSPVYNNDTTAFRPEVWAEEGVRVLYDTMVYAGLVRRDFEPDIANFGDTVHTRKINTFEAKRKQNDLDVTTDQDATATNIEVKLNQRVYTRFTIGDGERSKSFQDLVKVFLVPAMKAPARMLDRVVAGQVYQFRGNRAGALGQMSTVNAHDYLIDSRGVLNDLNVEEFPRMMGLANRTETIMQKSELFKSAEKIGDGGRALRNALLGRIGGWDTFRSINTPSISNATTAATTTTSAAYPAGYAGVIAVASGVATPVGSYIVIDGDYTPLRVLTVSTNDITVDKPLLRAVASGAVVRPYATGLIDSSAAIAAGDTTAAVASGYPAGWIKEIHVDGTGVPKVGQLVSFRTAAGAVHTTEYCIVQVTPVAGDYEILLDQPLANAVPDNDIVCYGPTGDYNFGFTPEGIALVNRPLALPMEGMGARAANGRLDNMSLRVTMAYDKDRQGTQVTIDGLYGIKVLDTQFGMVMFG
jgi:hypothetical protein